MASQSFYMCHNQAICSQSCGKFLRFGLLISLHPTLTSTPTFIHPQINKRHVDEIFSKITLLTTSMASTTTFQKIVRNSRVLHVGLIQKPYTTPIWAVFIGFHVVWKQLTWHMAGRKCWYLYQSSATFFFFLFLKTNTTSIEKVMLLMNINANLIKPVSTWLNSGDYPLASYYFFNIQKTHFRVPRHWFVWSYFSNFAGTVRKFKCCHSREHQLVSNFDQEIYRICSSFWQFSKSYN